MEAQAILAKQQAGMKQPPDQLEGLPERVAALMSDLGRLKRHADHLAGRWHTMEEPQTEVATLVVATLAQMQNLVELVVPFMARQLRLEENAAELRRGITATVLPAWADKLGRSMREWLAEFPQDALDDPRLPSLIDQRSGVAFQNEQTRLEVLAVLRYEQRAAEAGGA